MAVVTNPTRLGEKFSARSWMRSGVSLSASTMSPDRKFVPNVSLTQDTTLRTTSGVDRISWPSWSTSSAPNTPMNAATSATMPNMTSPVASPRRMPPRSRRCTTGSMLIAKSQARNSRPRKRLRDWNAQTATWNTATATSA